MSLSGLEYGASVPFCRITLYWSAVNWLFHSASVLITFLIPLDFEVSPRASFELPFGLLGFWKKSAAVIGSLASTANAPSAMDDERKLRLFMSGLYDIECRFPDSNYVRHRPIGF